MIEIEKLGGGSYLIKLNGAMNTIVSEEELMKICKEVQKDKKNGDPDFEIEWQDIKDRGNDYEG